MDLVPKVKTSLSLQLFNVVGLPSSICLPRMTWCLCGSLGSLSTIPWRKNQRFKGQFRCETAGTDVHSAKQQRDLKRNLWQLSKGTNCNLSCNTIVVYVSLLKIPECICHLRGVYKFWIDSSSFWQASHGKPQLLSDIHLNHIYGWKQDVDVDVSVYSQTNSKTKDFFQTLPFSNPIAPTGVVFGGVETEEFVGYVSWSVGR